MGDSGDSGRGVFAAALAELPHMGSHRLTRLLHEARYDAERAWAMARTGEVCDNTAESEIRQAWVTHAAGVDLERLGESLVAQDVWVTLSHEPGHPSRLVSDIDPAPVIFRQGLPVDGRAASVTIVGTRRCSPTGRSVAFELGAELAEAGVTVVSGLALGIDGAAHRGALSVKGAPPVGVVGSGLDVVYPRANNELWHAIAEGGTLLSECPLGGRPEGWRFPARNRILAALGDVVVVVESKRFGGSMHTVEEASRRGVTVMAVPGSVRNSAAAGTNHLLCEGCPPACSTEDVLVALGLATKAGRVPDPAALQASLLDDDPAAGATTPATVTQGGSQAGLTAVQAQVLEAIDDQPVSLDRVVLRVGAPAPAVVVAVAQLTARGLLARHQGQLIRV